MIKAVKSFVAPTEFTGWHMFTIICMFFGTIITVNMILAFNAGSTWTGLVVKNTYVASQIFNEEQHKMLKDFIPKQIGREIRQLYSGLTP